MTIRTPLEAAKVAENTHTNEVGMCQKVTHEYYLAPSAGDQDHDGDADAEDGWLAEPKSARRTDRNPPRGYPCAMSTSTHWHRLISLGNGILRSTDFDGVTKRYRPGVLGNGTVAEIERAMNARWVGWSTTIDGVPIPPDPPTRVENFLKGGPRWDVKILDRAIADGRQDLKPFVEKIDASVRRLPHDKNANSRVNQFRAAYEKNRVLRLGLLSQAVNHGRHGLVEHVRDDLRHLIGRLPRH